MRTDHDDHGIDDLPRAARIVDAVLRPRAGERLVVLVTGDGAVACDTADAALAAGAAVVVVQGTPGPLADAELRRRVPDAIGPLPPDAVRERLAALSPSGRADVVLAADGDLAAAARLVRRGGTIAAVVPPTTRPSITTVVQRELSLPATRGPAGDAVPPDAPRTRTTEGAEHGH